MKTISVVILVTSSLHLNFLRIFANTTGIEMEQNHAAVVAATAAAAEVVLPRIEVVSMTAHTQWEKRHGEHWGEIDK